MYHRRIPKMIENYSQHMNEISDIADNGYTIAFNFSYGRGVQYLDYTYPEAWQEEYTTKNYAAMDPTVLLNMAFPSTRRWSEFSIKATDVAGIFKKAAVHGLSFGATSCVKSEYGHSFLSVSRTDRDFTDIEMAFIGAKLVLLNGIVNADVALSTRETATLDLLAQGKSQEEISLALNVSVSTVKNIIKDLKRKFSADNVTEVVANAMRRGNI